MTQDQNKSPQDDQAWFDALSGKSDAGQAARLRSVLREVELAEATQEDTTQDWERLQFALRREDAQATRTKRPAIQFYALAASVLVLVGTVSLMLPLGEETTQPLPTAATVMRGNAEQVLFSSTAAKDAKQLELELQLVGVKVSKTETPEKTVLRIQLQHPVTQAVRAVLEARVIPVPDQGDLNVVYMQVEK